MYFLKNVWNIFWIHQAASRKNLRKLPMCFNENKLFLSDVQGFFIQTGYREKNVNFFAKLQYFYGLIHLIYTRNKY